jgi:hypothetical protein
MKYAKGVSWIEDTRIPFVDEVRTIPVHSKDKKTDETLFGLHPTIQHHREITTQGRFTPNLLVCDDMLNDGIVRKSDYNPNAEVKQYGGGNFGGGKTNSNNGYGDAGSSSRFYDLDKWFDNMIDKL